MNFMDVIDTPRYIQRNDSKLLFKTFHSDEVTDEQSSDTFIYIKRDVKSMFMAVIRTSDFQPLLAFKTNTPSIISFDLLMPIINKDLTINKYRFISYNSEGTTSTRSHILTFDNPNYHLSVPDDYFDDGYILILDPDISARILDDAHITDPWNKITLGYNQRRIAYNQSLRPLCEVDIHSTSYRIQKEYVL